MDPRIENLKTTTFFGRRLTRREVAGIQETVATFPALSRHELALTICKHLNWYGPKGDYLMALRVQEKSGSIMRKENAIGRPPGVPAQE